MQDFAKQTKAAFEAYHNMPYEPAVWTTNAAIGYIMEFLAHHDSVDEMPGLREAVTAMTPTEWDAWRKSYPDQRQTLIDPLHAEITAQQQTT